MPGYHLYWLEWRALVRPLDMQSSSYKSSMMLNRISVGSLSRVIADRGASARVKAVSGSVLTSSKLVAMSIFSEFESVFKSLSGIPGARDLK